MSVFKPNTDLLNGRHYDCRQDETLNEYQKAHLRGEFDVYKPIPTDSPDHLPPLAYQWATDWKRRYKNAQSTGTT